MSPPNIVLVKKLFLHKFFTMKKGLLVLFVLIGSTLFTQAQEVLNPTEFAQAIQNEGVQLLDVRTASEFETGFIKGALQADWTNKSQFQERIVALDKTKTVYVYCLSGGRSGAAQQWMLANGFTKVINMKGGINAWNQANLPLVIQKETAQISMEEFKNSLSKSGKTLVDFGATWCPPCKKMAPIVDELKAEGKPIVNIDGGVQKSICKELSISMFPTFIVFENGKELKRVQGLATKEELLKLLE